MLDIFKQFFGNDMSASQKARLMITGIVFAIMVVFTITTDLAYRSRPLQVRELAGKQVSMEKLADVFLGMDDIALESHFRRMWTYNGVLFLGALLLIGALKESGKK